MKIIYWTICTTATLLALSQSSWAVMPKGINAPANTSVVNTSGTIERGGMINSIDLDHKTISIDGITYPLPTSSVSIHPGGHRVEGKNLSLEKGMLIRFNTVKEKYSDREIIKEIWISAPKK